MKKKIIVAVGLLIASYLGLTWFFFGSPHPCGISEARQRPYYIERSKKLDRESLEFWRQRMDDALRSREALSELVKGYSEAVEKYINAPEEAAARLHKRVWLQTPAQCFWQAITWKAPGE